MLLPSEQPIEQIAHLQAQNAALEQEIKQHQRALAERDAHVQQLNQEIATLRASEKRFKRLFESNVVGMVFLKLTGEIIAANDLFLQMLGYTRQELELGLIRWDEITPPEYAAMDQQVIAEAMKTGIGMPWEKEYFRKDGSRVPVLVGGGLIEGLVNEGIAFSIDISKQRAAQAERNLAEQQLKASLRDKEVLLREIHHRVKNNLQMISSLLNLQASSIQDSHILLPFRESQNRIKAMALIHEKLYQSTSLAKVAFPEYIQALVEELLRSYSMASSRIQLHCDIADLELDIDTVIPCGLIINELVSNAIKYAFPCSIYFDPTLHQPTDPLSMTSNGIIRIGFRLNDEQHYVLTVADNGVGMPESLDFRQTRSLGFQLVNALTTRLRGSIELTCETGTLFTLTFKGSAFKNE